MSPTRIESETRIEDLMTEDVAYVTVEETMSSAASQLRERNCGAVPIVTQDGRVRGMLTDRDMCIAAYTKGLPLSEIPVEAGMAREVFTCREGDSPSEVLRTMAERQVRRIPVVDEEGRLRGIVSMNDFARAAAAGRVDGHEVIAALAAICGPSRREPRPAA